MSLVGIDGKEDSLHYYALKSQHTPVHKLSFETIIIPNIYDPMSLWSKKKKGEKMKKKNHHTKMSHQGCVPATYPMFPGSVLDPLQP